MIGRAARKRNEVVHYRVALNKFEWKKLYSQLFDFIHFFHFQHLGTDLHSHITRGNWDVEAGLVEFFRENFVIYDGVDVHKSTPKEIIASQRIVGYSDEQSEYYRIKYGEEVFMFTKAFAQRGAPCPDCS